MTNAASIKAGETWVGINARMGNLKQVLDKAASHVGSFAGSLNQIGEKIGGKFGGKIVSGLVGYFGVSLVDSSLRSIAETMEQNLAADRRMFEGVGEAIGESITKGLESIPIVGSLGRMHSDIADETLFGGAMSSEARLERTRASAERLAAIYREIEAVNERLKQSSDPAAIQDRRRMDKEASDLQAKLRAEIAAQGGTATQSDLSSAAAWGFGPLAGVGVLAQIADANQNQAKAISSMAEVAAKAAEGTAELRDAIAKQFSDRANDAIWDAAAGFNELFGLVDENARAFDALEEKIRSVSAALEAAGRGDEIDNVTAALRQEFAAAQARAQQIKDMAKAAEEERKAMEEAERIQKSIEEIVSSIEDKNESYGKSERELLEARLLKLNATQEQIDRALAAFDELAKKQSDAEAAASISTSLSAIGSFSPYAFDQFGGGSGAITDATQQTARNTKRMVELLQKQATTYGA